MTLLEGCYLNINDLNRSTRYMYKIELHDEIQDDIQYTNIPSIFYNVPTESHLYSYTYKCIF